MTTSMPPTPSEHEKETARLTYRYSDLAEPEVRAALDALLDVHDHLRALDPPPHKVLLAEAEHCCAALVALVGQGLAADPYRNQAPARATNADRVAAADERLRDARCKCARLVSRRMSASMAHLFVALESLFNEFRATAQLPRGRNA